MDKTLPDGFQVPQEPWQHLQTQVRSDVRQALEVHIQKQELQLQDIRRELRDDMNKAIVEQLRQQKELFEKIVEKESIRIREYNEELRQHLDTGHTARSSIGADSATTQHSYMSEPFISPGLREVSDTAEAARFGNEAKLPTTRPMAPLGDTDTEALQFSGGVNIQNRVSVNEFEEDDDDNPQPMLTRGDTGISHTSMMSISNVKLMHRIQNFMKENFTRPPTFEKTQVGKNCLGRMIHGFYFRFVTGMLILANSVYLGFYAHTAVHHELDRLRTGTPGSPKADGWWVSHVFNALFFVELILRVAGDRRRFLFGYNWQWHLFDAFLVLTPLWNIIEMARGANSLDEVPNISFFRIISLIRVIHTYQFFRMPIFAELRMMMNSMLRSLPSFFWATAIGAFWMYIFGVGFLLGVSRYLHSIELDKYTRTTIPEEACPDLLYFSDPSDLSTYCKVLRIKKHFSSLSETMKWLFMSISNGVDWEDVFNTVKLLPAEYPVFFIFYIVFMVYAMLNIISGMFIERAFKVVNQDRDFGILEEATEQKMYEDRLKGLFHELDIDKNGKLSWEEFEETLTNSHVMAYFSWLGVDTSQAHDVFNLLDVDGDNNIRIDEFLNGCSELRGPATNIEVKLLRSMLEEQQRLSQTIYELVGKEGTERDKSFTFTSEMFGGLSARSVGDMMPSPTTSSRFIKKKGSSRRRKDKNWSPSESDQTAS